MSFITTRDGTRLFVKAWGEGHPVVMIPGWPLSSDTFDDLAMAVASAGFRAIAYDRRGFGRSEQPWGGYDYDTLADDLADVLHLCDGEDVTLVGFSMGGGEIARYLSRHRGRRVERAILVGSIVPYMLKTSDNPHGVDHSVFDAMTQSLRADRAHFWPGFFKQFYGAGLLSHPVSDEVIDWSGNIAMQASLKATIDCVHAFGTTDFRPDLRAFTIPTLLIHGTDDKIVPIDASARAAARVLAGCRLIEYEGGPHGLLATDKIRLAKDVLEFIGVKLPHAVVQAPPPISHITL